MPPKRTNEEHYKRRKRTHNLGGCETCRKRHVKCDRTRPLCTTCHTAGLQCKGFPPLIRWAPTISTPSLRGQVASSSHDSRQRVGDSVYTQVDRDARVMNLHSTDIADSSYATHSERITQTNDSTSSRSIVGSSAFEESRLIETSSPLGTESVSELCNKAAADLDTLLEAHSILRWDDLFDTGFDYTTSFSDSNIDTQILHETDEGTFSVDTLGIAGQSGCTSNEHDITARGTPQTGTQAAFTAQTVLDIAPALLRYFKTVVVPQFGPLLATPKSPWNINICNTAVQILADLTFFNDGNVKHASKAILFGVLACSSYHARRTPLEAVKLNEYDLLGIHDLTASMAQHHLQESLRIELNGSQKAKYKHQLMAILIAAALAALHGNENSSRCLLIDAERILRVRGLTKLELSRRARVLHHVYTWLRIVGESTFVIHTFADTNILSRTQDSLQHARNERPYERGLTAQTARSLTEGSTQLDDFLRVQPHEGESEPDLDVPKDSNVGLRDIHLEDMRQYPQTMYLQVYGIPEAWLSLLSQTTRLANIMDALEAGKDNQASGLTDLVQRKTRRLEHLICTFASQMATESNPKMASQHGAMEPVSANAAMLRAMTSALVLFFYRRIRKVHPWILQGHVRDVVDALKTFDRCLAEASLSGPGTPWPAFVAGCEAMDAADQALLLAWVDNAARVSTSASVGAAAEIMREVWRRRGPVVQGSSEVGGSVGADRGSAHQRAGLGCSWVEVLREKNKWLMLY